MPRHAAPAAPAPSGPGEPDAPGAPDAAGPADLRPADLRPADLRPADLRPADLRPTDLRPTDLRPTDLRPVAAELGRSAMAAADGGSALVALPPGVLAAVVTWLEMTGAPPARPDPPTAAGLRLERWPAPDPTAYRALYRTVGEDWLWFSRLRPDDDALAAVLADPAVEVYRPVDADGAVLGLLELDFRAMPDSAELAFFGLAPGAVGRGAGRWLMNRALEIAWRRVPAPARLTVHTCTLDHPSALDFYRRSGFRPVARAVELTRDPRLDGILPADAAAGVPVL